jgi:hypothetical protein
MHPRQDVTGEPLELRAYYSVPALARIAKVTRFTLLRLLKRVGVRFAKSTGRTRLVPQSEIQRKIPPLWDALILEERVRRGIL